MYDVRDIANFTLDFADKKGLKLTNLALQKLLYFMHGWFYAMYDQPLIKNKFEAWQYGPVQRVIYDQFKTLNNAAIVGVRATYINPETGEPQLRDYKVRTEHADLLVQVLARYENYSVGQLVEESHAEDGPWEYVWKQAEDAVYPGMKIPDALIIDHFRRLTPVVTLH